MMSATRFNPAILISDPQRRARILPILDAALDAVDPGAAVQRMLTREGDLLRIAGRSWDLHTFQNVTVLSFGKAAVTMTGALCELLGDRISAGIALTKVGHAAGREQLPASIAVLEAGHPVPDEAGVAASRRIAELAEQAAHDDLVICLVSGGGSALLTYPAPGLSLADLQATTEALLRCGATIDQINTLRKHLEVLKGGQLARLVAPATLITLVLSDVVGSLLDVIASGPTVPDRSTWADASRVVENHSLTAVLPPAVIDRLRAGLAGKIPDTPKTGDPSFADSRTVVVADNALAAEAAAAAAQRGGFNSQVLTTFLEGEAREVARFAVALAREVAVHQRPLAPPACLILGGETTVTIHGQGKGGRNQELALAAALQLQHIAHGQRVVIVSLATDGSDGPTDAAGGMVDAGTVARGTAAGLHAADHLSNNDAYPFLAATDDLLLCGPTQTNVNDLIFVFVF